MIKVSIEVEKFVLKLANIFLSANSIENCRSLQIAVMYANESSHSLGTGQYFWEYGTGKFATGPPVILVL